LAILGLLSDSHGRADATRLAVARLRAAGAEILIHLGDIESPAVLDELRLADAPGQPALPARVVFGNMDHDWPALARYATQLGLYIAHPVGRLDLGAKTLIYLHGNDQTAMNHALAQQPDYLCHGHTHHSIDERLGSTRIINPGALFRARPRTAATLDTASDSLTFLNLDHR
jgi:uncharacterized protein